jgi:hypothetical protein
MKKAQKPTDPSKVETTAQTGAPPAPDGGEGATSLELVRPLTAEEERRLGELEKVIDAKLGDFFEVGSAIMEIKTRELYRETHKNFNTYCQERWGFGRSYANKLIGSAARIQLLPAEVPKPANEFQIRPFLRLEPEEFPQKWQAIVKTAGEGKVTSKIVEESLNLPKKKRKKRTTRPAAEKEGVAGILQSIRAALKEKNVEGALKHLDKLEKLLKA